MRAPELEPNAGWVNKAEPLSLHGQAPEGLGGRVVLLEFWSPGRIDCDLVLPELAWFAQKYRDEPVEIVGVCSVETEAEEAIERVTHDVRRRRIGHPVVIDRGFKIWRAYGVSEWPTLALVDPVGQVVGKVGGLGNRMLVDRYIARLLADHRAGGTLVDQRGGRSVSECAQEPGGLMYPMGLVGAAPSLGEPGWLCVSDTGHDRLVISEWPDEEGVARTRMVIGGHGFADGGACDARFHEPVGLAVHASGRGIYVADRRNHAIRSVEVDSGRVSTLVGCGEAGAPEQEGGAGSIQQPLRSPSGLCLDRVRGRLLVVMTGDHRVWSVDLTTMVARPVAGTGHRGTSDGRFDSARFDHPVAIVVSGDGAKAWLVEAIGSAVRELDLEDERVTTIGGEPLGGDDEPGVLSRAGDSDGEFPLSRFRHPGGCALRPNVSMLDADHRLLVADTRNGLLREIEAAERNTARWPSVNPAFQAPGAVSVINRADGSGETVFVCETDAHRVVRVEPESGARTPLLFEGL